MIHRRSRRWPRPVLAVLAIVALLCGVAGVADAYWSHPGSGAGTSRTGTINAPSAVSGTQTAGTGTVTVTWSASGGTPTPSGYYVTRTDSGNNTVAACGTSPTSPVVATTCHDSSVPIGNYTYQVVAVFNTWTASSATSPTVAVAQAPQTITYTSSVPTAATYHGSTYTVTATGGASGNPVTFTSATPSVCTVTVATVSFVGVGTCTINADQASSTYYSAATQVQQSFNVGQAGQTITFTSTAPSNATFSGTPYTVTATGGGSGQQVVFSSATPSVCTVTGSTVSFGGVGTCTINANQAGNTDYGPAGQAQQSFTVSKAAQTITYTSTAPSNAVVGGTTYTVTATGGGSGNSVSFTVDAASAGSCTIAGATVSFAHAGTCVIDANQAGNANFAAAGQVQQSFTVGKGSQAITFTSTPPSPSHVGGTYTVTASGGASGNAVTFTVDASSVGCTLSGTTVTFTAQGTCLIDANQAGNADYLAAVQTQQSISVTRINQAITFTSTPPTAFSNSTYTVAATGGGSGNPVTFTSATISVCTVSGTTVTLVTAGTCTIDANQAGNIQYNAAPQVAQTFSTTKGNQSVSFTSTAPTTATVGGTTYSVTASATSGLTPAITVDSASTSVCSINGSNVVSFLAAGTCTLDANQSGNGNWNAASQVQQSFTVKQNQSITFTSTAPNPGSVGNTYAPTASATSGLTVTITVDSGSSSVCSASGATVTFNTTGTCVLDANQSGNGTWNAAVQVQQSITVTGTKVTSVVLANADGQAAKGDTLTITFNGPLQANTICSAWTGNSGGFTGNSNGTSVTITKTGANDQLTVTNAGCTFTIGTIDLGTAAYTSSTVTFGGNGSNTSSIQLTSSGVLTITLGTGTSSSGAPATSTVTYTPNSGIKDSNGVAVGTAPFAAANQRF